MPAFFPLTVYLLCAVTSGVCSWLLARSFVRTRARLLFWSALCFGFLAVNHVVAIVDVLVPDIDFALPRSLLSLAAVSVLLFGFVWDLEREA